MACELTDCSYYGACVLAESVVAANPNNLMSEHVQRQKLAELATTQIIFEKVSPECTGQKEDGTCGSSGKVNDTRSFIFTTPGVEIVAKDNDSIGFKSQN